MAAAATERYEELRKQIEQSARPEQDAENVSEGEKRIAEKYEALKIKYNRLMHVYTECNLKLHSVAEGKTTIAFTEVIVLTPVLILLGANTNVFLNF